MKLTKVTVGVKTKSTLASSVRPKLIVNRSNRFIYAQIVDKGGRVLAAANSLRSSQPQTEQAVTVGQQIAAKAKEQKISAVVFDRNGRAYRGALKRLAEAAREGGLVI